MLGHSACLGPTDGPNNKWSNKDHLIRALIGQFLRVFKAKTHTVAKSSQFPHEVQCIFSDSPSSALAEEKGTEFLTTNHFANCDRPCIRLNAGAAARPADCVRVGLGLASNAPPRPVR